AVVLVVELGQREGAVRILDVDAAQVRRIAGEQRGREGKERGPDESGGSLHVHSQARPLTLPAESQVFNRVRPRAAPRSGAETTCLLQARWSSGSTSRSAGSSHNSRHSSGFKYAVRRSCPRW